jgi:hypothetical protein
MVWMEMQHGGGWFFDWLMLMVWQVAILGVVV